MLGICLLPMLGVKKDHTNYDQKYAQRYNDFKSMIEIPQSEHQCTLYKSITHELMKVGRSECHTHIVHPRLPAQDIDSEESVNNWAVRIINTLT